MTERVEDLRGRVVRRAAARGSKSERRALVVCTERGDFILRRKGGPAYGDRTLDRYDGKVVACTGVLATHTLLAERIRELDE